MVGVLLGESVVRFFQLSIDVPEMYRDSDNLIKFRPNQKGSYNGEHQWIINSYGNYGYEPPSLDSLVTVLGDSYISNVMNPPRCHQANYLANLNQRFNFFPSSRDGASFIELLEMKKSLRNYQPLHHLFYVHHEDFIESIAELGRKPLTVQVSLETGNIKQAQLTSSPIKTFLYNFKFAYFIYRNFLVSAFTDVEPDNNTAKKNNTIDLKAIESLLKYTKRNYITDDLTLVFSPKSNPKVIEIAAKNGFDTLSLKAMDYKSWQLEHDSHWSCSGHLKAATQVNSYLNNASFSPTNTLKTGEQYMITH